MAKFWQKKKTNAKKALKKIAMQKGHPEHSRITRDMARDAREQ